MGQSKNFVHGAGFIIEFRPFICKGHLWETIQWGQSCWSLYFSVLELLIFYLWSLIFDPRPLRFPVLTDFPQWIKGQRFIHSQGKFRNLICLFKAVYFSSNLSQNVLGLSPVPNLQLSPAYPSYRQVFPSYRQVFPTAILGTTLKTVVQPIIALESAIW